jgi:hypothetical protein
MVGDEAQSERRLIVGVEIGPVRRHDDLFAKADNFRHPRREHVPHHDASIAQQSIDLLDRMSCANDWPMIDTASEALVMTPSAPLANDAIRFACKHSSNIALR